jgi:hypothetical protein
MVEPHAQAIPLLLAEVVLKRTLFEATESRYVFTLNTINLERHPLRKWSLPQLFADTELRIDPLVGVDQLTMP